jgi:predicted RNase H-like nuclease (RuvC/YqgF family)
MEQTQQAGTQLKALVDRAKQETEQLRSELERAREETVAHRVDAERAKQEAEHYKAQAAELAKKLQASQSKPEGGDRTKLSTVDKIIEGNSSNEEQPSPSHLY